MYIICGFPWSKTFANRSSSNMKSCGGKLVSFCVHDKLYVCVLCGNECTQSVRLHAVRGQTTTNTYDYRAHTDDSTIFQKHRFKRNTHSHILVSAA